MPVDYEALEKAVRARFEKDVLNWTVSRGMPILHIRRGAVIEVLKFLRDDESTKFNVLTDVTCVDYLKAPSKMEAGAFERFAIVYQLTSLANKARFRVKAWVPEEPCEIDSATSLWNAANWGEREVYDMFGILFKGHPDLRRILMPENYEGHPLRKDYPLKGRGERDNFPKFHELTKES